VYCFALGGKALTCFKHRFAPSLFSKVNFWTYIGTYSGVMFAFWLTKHM
jgi:hypothetical protein